MQCASHLGLVLCCAGSRVAAACMASAQEITEDDEPIDEGADAVQGEV